MSPKRGKPEVFTEKHWKRPDPQETGDSKIDDIYAAVGYATSQWELVDQALANLYLAFVGASNGQQREILRRSYGTIFGNAGRRNAVLSAGEVFFGGYWNAAPVRESLINILFAIEKAASLRDDIVHGVASGPYRVHNDPTNPRQMTDYGSFLMPPEYNTKFTTTGMLKSEHALDFLRCRYRYTSSDIKKIAEKFVNLRWTIESYARSVPPEAEGVPSPLIVAMYKDGRLPTGK
jgi:hypothetical protein